jgi:hypothetical protein
MRALRPATRIVVVGLFIALATFGLTESLGVTGLFATALRIASPHGTLIVETDDPDIGIRIDGEELVLTGTGVAEIRLKPGAHEFVAAKDDEILKRELISVERDGRRTVRVSAEPRPAAQAEVAPVATPPADEPPESEPATPDDEQAKRLAELLDSPSVWKGTRTYRRGAFAGISVPYEIHFRTRDGKALSGDKFDNGAGRNFGAVTGTLEGSKLVWHEQAPRGDSFDVKGELVGDEIRIAFTGRYPGGAPTEGDGVLKRYTP